MGQITRYSEKYRDGEISILEIDESWDHMGDFITFSSCIESHIKKASIVSETTLVVHSMNQGKPRLDEFNYDPALGIESLRDQFDAKYGFVVEQ